MLSNFFHWLRGDILIEDTWYTKVDVKRLFPLVTAKAIRFERLFDEANQRAFLLAVENSQLKQGNGTSR